MIDRPERVRALISSGRVGFLKNADILANLLCAGVRYTRSTGPYWEKSMTLLMEGAIADGAEYLLTVDWDSYFSVADVAELVRLMDAHPEAGAICSIQMRRYANAVLLAPLDVSTPMNERSFESELLPLATGNFGLTILRASEVNTLPRPWFHSCPDADGRWSDKSTDADVGFWHRWRDCGRTLMCATRVVIGHGEEIIVWPSGRFDKPLYQYPYQWDKFGKPAGAL